MARHVDLVYSAALAAGQRSGFGARDRTASVPAGQKPLTITGITLGATEIMTTAKKITLMATAGIALTVPMVKQWRKAKELRAENEALRTENRQLRSDQHELAESLKDKVALVAQLQRDTAELPALRGEVASSRQHPGGSRELRPQSAEAGNDPSDEASKRTDPMNRMNEILTR